VKANRLLELLLRQEARVRLCLVGQAKPAASVRPRPDFRQQPVTGCRLDARPRELAAERSWDFRL